MTWPTWPRQEVEPNCRPRCSQCLTLTTLTYFDFRFAQQLHQRMIRSRGARRKGKSRFKEIQFVCLHLAMHLDSIWFNCFVLFWSILPSWAALLLIRLDRCKGSSAGGFSIDERWWETFLDNVHSPCIASVVPWFLGLFLLYRHLWRKHCKQHVAKKICSALSNLYCTRWCQRARGSAASRLQIQLWRVSTL